MTYSEYVNGLIQSQSTISSGSEIQKTNAIGFITTSTQFNADLLLNSALVILSLPIASTITFPTKALLTTALSTNNYTLTNGIIIDIVLVNITNNNITLNFSDLFDPTLALPTTMVPNQTNYYKIISNIPSVNSFIIYLISGGGGGGGGDIPNLTTTDVKTAVGVDALLNRTGGFNTAVGNMALAANNNTFTNNTAIGHNALSSCIGNNNTAVGTGTNVVSGNNNTLLGYNANALSNSGCLLLGAGAIATTDNQLVINAGTVDNTPPVAPITASWTVRINGNTYKIPLYAP